MLILAIVDTEGRAKDVGQQMCMEVRARRPDYFAIIHQHNGMYQQMCTSYFVNSLCYERAQTSL